MLLARHPHCSEYGNGSSNGHSKPSYGGSSNGYGSGGGYRAGDRDRGGYGSGARGGDRNGFGSSFGRSSGPSAPPGPIEVNREFLKGLENDTNRSSEEIAEYFKSEEITVRGRDVPKPVLQFGDLNWPSRVNDGFRRQGYTKPTPIQAVGWPIALAGRNLVGIAQTGSGKTLGYCLPAYIHIEGQPRARAGKSIDHLKRSYQARHGARRTRATCRCFAVAQCRDSMSREQITHMLLFS